MTNFKQKKYTGQDPQNDELLGPLFKYASARPKAPAEDEAAIRVAVHGEWKQVTRQRKLRRYAVSFGLAASLILTVVLVANLGGQKPTVTHSKQVAKLETSSGEVFDSWCAGQHCSCPSPRK